ncbi:3'-5'-exoribonuclease [Exophiala dermatitidis]|uniref:3'-5'-exoribonuclease n=1 Tax=Exophiala dermatitidis TaxID=5970 RepID=A0AAN6ISD9_EXODE|nr:3'-5'-exoribonuclease [Exophiala dermatitidis]KAJ4507795.1 3'-5'-exoribonuclease [Exophiala dermatitidis]KAJ4509934.1 3'-5'-exoribonuclease [Exophiala dermatitidis]KAJ4539510.1 3'-5'-exoribonuclease [Exophiala dermatitidis]KAJ4542710.1 3'-5'-exoribonuclease [Exophiala dermatitidis]
MTDRRRLNGPAGTTSPPVFAPSNSTKDLRQTRQRKPNELRKIFLQTGVIPSATGSAYLELECPPRPKAAILNTSSTIKLSCSVYGPKPLPRTASFSPNLQLSASVKFAPFATRVRQGYIRDSTERDISMHLETALKGVIIPDRWPKSAIDIAVTVLEGEDDQCDGDRFSGIGLFNVLAGCINVAMAALADARVDCLDVLAAGVGALVPGKEKPRILLDPACTEHEEVQASCLVGYLPSRDEVVEVWSNGSVQTVGGNGGIGVGELVDSAVAAARGAQTVIKEVLIDAMARTEVHGKKMPHDGTNDVEMMT